MARSIIIESLAAISFGMAIGVASDMLARQASKGSVKCMLDLFEKGSSKMMLKVLYECCLRMIGGSQTAWKKNT